MIQIPYEQILQRIMEKTQLSEAEIGSRVNEKLKALSGLISREGAAHIIANQLGVALIEKTSGRLEIKNILIGMRDVETVGKVQAVYGIKEFQTQSGSGKVGSFMLSDETGIIRIVLWGSLAEKLAELKEGDIVRIQSGYVKNNNSRKEVHMNDRSRILINPDGETLGAVKEFKRDITRKKISELKEDDMNVELFGTIVQAYEPRYFEICPSCGRRAQPNEAGFNCQQHGKVSPAYSYVMNIFLDDGSSNTRVVCFRNQAQHLTGKTHDELLKYKEQPQDFEQIKTDLLGTIAKFVGRVKKNETLGLIDFIAEQVFTNIKPEEEIKRLEAVK